MAYNRSMRLFFVWRILGPNLLLSSMASFLYLILGILPAALAAQLSWMALAAVFLGNLALMLASIGFLASLGLFHRMHRPEWYQYYNHGLRSSQLIFLAWIACLGLALTAGTLAFWLGGALAGGPT